MEEDAFDFYTELQEQYDEDSDSYDDESDDSDREVAESVRDAWGTPMNKVLSFLDATTYHENIPPNPYSSREDLGIESKCGNDIKEVYFGGT